MITFARGLVLRDGDRVMEFERQLDASKVQFKYQDNFEIRTFSMGGLYASILGRKIQVVHQNGHKINLPTELNIGDAGVTYSLEISKRQEDLIAYRLRYVRAAMAMRATSGSRRKCAAVIEHVAKKDLDANPPSTDTLMAWLARFVHSGLSPYSLMDRRPFVRKPKRIHRATEELLEFCIAKYYLQLRGLSAKDTYAKFKQEVRALERQTGEQISLPSVRTCHRRIQEIDPYIRDLKRFGKQYTDQRWRHSQYGDQSTRVLQRVEIDHTWLDLWVLDPKSGAPIGRPWITIVIDRFSGYILGLYISFYGPSVASVAHAIKNSIFPKDELIAGIPGIQRPWTAMGVAEMYVIDNGLEFHSNAFRRLAWELRTDLLYNPVRRPWLKACVERSMMEVNRILPASGKVYKPQQEMKPQDPRGSSAILFDDLCDGLFRWAAEVFPNSLHEKNLVRPLDLWEEGRASSPLPMFPLGFDRFDITAGVSTTRVVDGDGVFFKYLRFNSYELQDYRRTDKLKFSTEIRFNPDNLERIHVYLPKANHWLPVELKRPSLEYGRGLSLIQHEIIREEAGKKLTQNNAEEELEAARIRLSEHWGEALARGIKVRRDSNLIRLQGYTSAKLYEKKKSETEATVPSAVLPIQSAATQKMLPSVMPYKTFTLDEELA